MNLMKFTRGLGNEIDNYDEIAASHNIQRGDFVDKKIFSHAAGK